MNRISYAGHSHMDQLTLYINMTDWGQGWKKLKIPIHNRSKILRALDRKLEMYNSNCDYRRNIGPGENVDCWLEDTVKFAC